MIQLWRKRRINLLRVIYVSLKHRDEFSPPRWTNMDTALETRFLETSESVKTRTKSKHRTRTNFRHACPPILTGDEYLQDSHARNVTLDKKVWKLVFFEMACFNSMQHIEYIQNHLCLAKTIFDEPFSSSLIASIFVGSQNLALKCLI